MTTPMVFTFYVTTYDKHTHYKLMPLLEECKDKGYQVAIDKVTLAIGDGAHDFYYSDIAITGEWEVLKCIQTSGLPVSTEHFQDH